jgi:C-terminal processing protease CtpA/Prc
MERRMRARLDSLRVVLDREPISSAEREQLRAESEHLVRVLSELSRFGTELQARIIADGSSHVTTLIQRGLAEGGFAEGLRRFEVAAPRGWIGIVAEAPNEYRIVGESQVIRYLDYPAIVSVDRNSPAARAGINAGDVLIAYDGSDVRDREINLTRLLVPDRRLSVTVRRDGETKQYDMTVARASQSVGRLRFETIRAPMDTAVVRAGSFGPQRRQPGSGSGTVVVGAMPTPATVFIARPGVSLVWGAQLSSINQGLGRTLGVSAGVLVLNVMPATPASRSGLDDGDIIVKVNGRPVTSVETLWRLSAERDAADHEVDLEVLRAKKPVKLTLRWAK